MKKLLSYDQERKLAPMEEKSLHTLFEMVDGLPLGIQVMVALMIPRMDKQQPVKAFRKYYEANSREALKRVDIDPDYDRDENRKVGETHMLDNVWHLSFLSLDDNALSVLGMLSFIAPNDISVSWFNLASREIPPAQTVLSICKKPFEYVYVHPAM